MTNALEMFETDLRPMEYWAMLADDKLTAWQSGKVEGYSTGFASLDRNFRFVNAELTVIAAASSMGKTALAMQMCEAIARQIKGAGDNGVVAIFSAEMTGWHLLMRMAGAWAGISIHAARLGKLTPTEFADLRAAVHEMRQLPIWIDDGSGPTTATMFARLDELNKTNPVRAMMFDFMELGGDKAQSEEQRVGGISLALKEIAKKLNIPVIALSQINRNVESTATKVPGLSDLRYSATIGHIADVALLVMRPEYYLDRGLECKVPEEDRQGVAYVNIAKNRHGPPVMEKLAFVKKLVKFAELERGSNER